ncbi:unnamed protein product [Caretta caretta]
MEKMERLLADWIDDLYQKKTPGSLNLIQEKAKSLSPRTGLQSPPNMKVLFLTSEIISLLQPMDQSAMPTFKAYYLWRTFFMLIKEMAGEVKPIVKKFWKSYNILTVMENIDEELIALDQQRISEESKDNDD